MKRRLAWLTSLLPPNIVNGVLLFPKKMYAKFRRLINNSLRVRPWGRKKNFNDFPTYTVVSGVYNSDKYLHDFFTSLTTQQLDFEKHIYLIMVDDGSTDSSAAIIKQWQKKYPDTILYIYQENRGVGSARNAGLPLVKTPWVTFIDPDDFVDHAYFARIDALIARDSAKEKNTEKRIKLITGNRILYHEDRKLYGSHVLESTYFSFKSGSRKLNLAKACDIMQTGAPCLFYRTEEIRKHGILFPENNWPTFEDGYFTLSYLLKQKRGKFVYCRTAYYYYRKKIEKNSRTSTAHLNKATYLDLPRESWLTLLPRCAAENPLFLGNIQNSIIYDLSWPILFLFDKRRPAMLTKEEVDQLFENYEKIFKYVTKEAILRFPYTINKFSEMHRLGILHTLKGEELPYVNVHMDDFDEIRREVSFHYFRGEREFAESVFIDGQKVEPAHTKTTTIYLAGRSFLKKRQIRVPVPPDAYFLELRIDNKRALFTVGETKSSRYLPVSRIYGAFPKHPAVPQESLPYKDGWMFIDRDILADDSAEILYRHVREKHPERKIFFSVRADTPDWDRLSKDGFNLVAFETPEYRKVLEGCSAIISSHADGYIMNYYKGMLTHMRFVFLQHGVIKESLAEWLNTKKISLFITSTKNEYDSIVANDSPYVFSSREVKLTGLPRHDALLANPLSREKIITVMPTWRVYLVGEILGQGNARRLSPDFMNSRYARSWQSFLNAPRLKAMARQAGYRIRFFPHLNTQPYLPFFTLGEHIETRSHADMPIRDCFKTTSILVTDFSSVAFDMALLQRAVLYYHFDHEEVLGEHVGAESYFKYDEQGFGPVALDEETLLENLEFLINRDGAPESKYLKRMQNTFAFTDGKNCERVYNEICNLFGEDHETDSASSAVDFACSAPHPGMGGSFPERGGAFHPGSSGQSSQEPPVPGA